MSLTPAESPALPDSLPTCPKSASFLIALTIFLLLFVLFRGHFGQLSDWLNTQVSISLSQISLQKTRSRLLALNVMVRKALLLLSHLLKDNVTYLFSVKHNWPYHHTKVPLARKESHLGTRHSSSLCLCQGTAERNNDILSGLGQGTSWYFSPQLYENFLSKTVLTHNEKMRIR